MKKESKIESIDINFVRAWIDARIAYQEELWLRTKPLIEKAKKERDKKLSPPREEMRPPNEQTQ